MLDEEESAYMAKESIRREDVITIKDAASSGMTRKLHERWIIPVLFASRTFCLESHVAFLAPFLSVYIVYSGMVDSVTCHSHALLGILASVVCIRLFLC